MRKILFVICILLIQNDLISAQNHKKEIIEYLKKEMKEQGIPGLQVAVIKKNRVLFSESLGIANVEFAVPVTNNTKFSINSIAKIFTSVAIMQLVEQNKLQLEKPISTYLTSIPIDWGHITIKQLLSHTSGLPDIENSIGDGLISDKGQDSAWAKVQTLPLQFKSGEKFNYNATNYLLLQKVIEKIENLPFEKTVQLHQLNVAKMQHTKYANSYDVIGYKAPTYSFYTLDKTTGEYIKTNRLTELYEDFPTSFRTDAGVFTSADDMVQWTMALQNGKFLKNTDNIIKMWEPVKLNNGTYDGFGGVLNSYALGWPIINRKTHFAASAFGGGRASVTIYPNDNLSIILFTNLTGIETYTMTENISKFYFTEIN